ncbi:right-handed parallel beta-helix repeat-containing protein [bacterium]|nr:right-handed parallel beta-helix repeat-containing protein [bacterium]
MNDHFLLEKIRHIRIFILTALLMISISLQAFHYIRADATGNNDGSDWNNAYTTLPAELERGATYYISDGNYESYTFDDAEGETQYIKIKKAIESDYGTDAGWQSSYGDGQAVFDILTFSTSYWIFDGQKRDDWENGYGFKIKPDESYQFNATKGIRLSWTDHITFRYIEIEQFGQQQFEVKQEGFYGPATSEILIQYSYVHDFMGNGILLHGENNIVEYSKIADSFGYGGTHSQGIQLFSNSVVNMTIRYNIFQDMRGTADIASAWGTDGLDIYGNIFYNTPGSSGYTSPAAIHDLSSGPEETGLTNAHIYNNLFYRFNEDHVNVNHNHAGVLITYTSDPSSNLIYNNLFVDCEDVNLDSHYNSDLDIYYSNSIHDYNYLINSDLVWNADPEVHDLMLTGPDPIIDADNGDFRLTASAPAINAGLDLTTLAGFNPDSVDPDQNIRGADGFWDIGAYEYVSAAPDQIALQIKTFLEGPYNAGTMDTGLQTDGHLPLQSPYDDTEVSAIPENVVDWVQVELRTHADESGDNYTKSVFLRNDGMVIDLDGSDTISVEAPEGDYFIVVKHRNHLSVMSDDPVNLNQ